MKWKPFGFGFMPSTRSTVAAVSTTASAAVEFNANRESTMPARKSAEKSAAVITIKEVPEMSKRGRREVAAWMRKQADFLESDGKSFSKRFTARYLYRD
jgi:hypothetical protein